MVLGLKLIADDDYYTLGDKASFSMAEKNQFNAHFAKSLILVVSRTGFEPVTH